MRTYSDLTAFLHYYFSTSTAKCTDRMPKKKRNSSPAREKTSAIGITLNARKNKFDYVISTSDWKAKQIRVIFLSAKMTEWKNAHNK